MWRAINLQFRNPKTYSTNQCRGSFHAPGSGSKRDSDFNISSSKFARKALLGIDSRFLKAYILVLVITSLIHYIELNNVRLL